MRKYYPYLNDPDFILKIDTERLQNQFVRIILLDWNENPLQEIQGIATGGSISLNGSSAVRRTCNLNMTVKEVSDGAISDVNNIISINKKIFLEIGIVNKTNQYTNYPIIWFPQGTFVISSCSIQTSLGGGTSLSAQFKDKMCLLNGECGGTIPACIHFEKYDTLNENGDIVTSYPTIHQIITELVNHWGKEQLGNIIIGDIDNRIKTVKKWTGSIPIYFYETPQGQAIFTTREPQSYTQKFEYGDDIGFEYVDFTYPEELVGNAGDNVCTILDKIKTFLGNYEYFYDVDGLFHFQEIKNYLNNTEAKQKITELNNDSYVIDQTKGKSVYSFTDNFLSTSFSNTPQFNKIKNDFIVWGIRENASQLKVPIRYHLAIDKKPEIGNIYEVFFFDDEDGITKCKAPVIFESKEDFPKQGAKEVFYMDRATSMIYKWDPIVLTYVGLWGINGCEVIEEPTVADFPLIGDEGKIYLATSTLLRYVWGLDPTSAHYAAIEKGSMEGGQLKELFDPKKQFDGEEISITSKEGFVQWYNDYYSSLEELINQKEKDKKEDEEKITAVDKSTILLRTRITQLKRTIEQDENEINKLRTAIEDLDPMKQRLIEQNQELTEALPLWKNMLNAVNSQIDALLATKKYWTQEQQIKYQELCLQQSDLLSKIADADATIEANKTTIDGIPELKNEYEEKIVKYKAEIVKYKQELAQKQAELEVYEDAEYRSWKEAVDTCNALIAQYQDKVSLLNEFYNDTYEEILQLQHEYIKATELPNLLKIKTTDWRSELYLQGVIAEPLGIESNYYYEELKNEWPKLYNLKATYNDEEDCYEGAFKPEVIERPTDIDYWLDFIDSDAAIGVFNVNSIGRRSLVENKNEYNCIFESEIPDYVLIEAGQEDTEDKRKECEDRDQKYSQIDSAIYALLGDGGHRNSCYNRIKEMLYNYTHYNNNISLSIIPIFHLEPNTRITVANVDSDIFGDFMINSISIPLAINGTMNISATKCIEKL